MAEKLGIWCIGIISLITRSQANWKPMGYTEKKAELIWYPTNKMLDLWEHIEVTWEKINKDTSLKLIKNYPKINWSSQKGKRNSDKLLNKILKIVTKLSKCKGSLSKTGFPWVAIV